MLAALTIAKIHGLGSIVKPAYPRMGWLRPLIALVCCGAAVGFFINGGCLLCFVLRLVFLSSLGYFEIIFVVEFLWIIFWSFGWWFLKCSLLFVGEILLKL